MATERLIPVTWHVRRKSLNEETIKWGLYNISVSDKYISGNIMPAKMMLCDCADANSFVISLIIKKTLAFIHNEATSVHGNLRLTSIFTTESGEWRLGGFEVLSSLKEDDAVIYVNHPFRLPLALSALSSFHGLQLTKTELRCNLTRERSVPAT